MSTIKAQQNLQILSQLPPEATRVKVLDAKGKKLWKDISQVTGGDVIQMDKNNNAIYMKGKPGRPAQTQLEPVTDLVAQIISEKQRFVCGDNLVQIATRDSEAKEILDGVISSLTEEIASLSYDRKELERNGFAATGVSAKKISALRSLGDLWLKRRDQMNSNAVDMESPAFRRLFKFVLDTFRSALRSSGIPLEQIDIVFNNLSKSMGEGWVEDAKNKMKET